MLNRESIQDSKESYGDLVYFLRKIFILKGLNLKKLVYTSPYNIQVLKGERGVHFLWK
jgi:hypothetical protein